MISYKVINTPPLSRACRATCFFAACLLLLSGCMGKPATEAPLTPQALSASPQEHAADLLGQMTDEQKIGQLLIIGIEGTVADDAALAPLRALHPSGVILFDRNMTAQTQVKDLNSALQDAAAQLGDPPLFLCVDQEGGSVARLREHLTIAPAAAELGAQNDPVAARGWAEKTGAELRGLGFNVNFAPVLDLGLSPGRSYGKDSAAVAAFALKACQGYAAAGLMTSLKHFPGIGKTAVDPHLSPYQIPATKEMLRKEDVAPFAALIEKLDHQTFFVMVSHLIYPAYDKDRPASVSPALLRDLLRGDLGFDGLVITDDMEMGALANLYAYEDMGVLAINAGADMALVCHSFSHQRAVYNGLLQALKSGALPRETVDRAVLRILETKFARDLP